MIEMKIRKKNKIEYLEWLLEIRRMSTDDLLDEVLRYADTYYHSDPMDERKHAFSVRLLRLRIKAVEGRKQ
jgi:hypothetical protein